MPNDHDAPFDEAERRQELAMLKSENAQLRSELQVTQKVAMDCTREAAKLLDGVRTDAAKVVYALDCAMQLTEVLLDERFRYLPEGAALLTDAVETCKYRLHEALKAAGIQVRE